VTLRSQLYFRLRLVVVVEFLGAREEEELRSDGQEQEDIDGTGEVKQCDSKKRSGRRYGVVMELAPPCY
jgi:hypothetical protein